MNGRSEHSGAPPSPQEIRRQAGVTIIELMVTIAIAAILLGIAAPSFTAIMKRNRMATEANSLTADLQFARGQAIKEGLPVTACISSDQKTCSTTATDWSAGWIVFSDPDANHVVSTSAPIDIVWRTQPAFSASGSTDTFGNGSTTYFTFSRDGFLLWDAGAAPTSDIQLSLQASPASASTSRCLKITRIGRQTVSTGACT